MLLRLLAELVADRVAPALPKGFTLAADGGAGLTISGAHMSRAVGIGFSLVRGWDAESVLVRVTDALNDIATEVGEATTDHYEDDADVEGDAIRIWFGLVPPGSPKGRWRDVLPELPPISLSLLRG